MDAVTTDPLLIGGASWTNLDEIRQFVLAWKGQKIPVGSAFTLPDIEQRYEVSGVKFFKVGGKAKVLLEISSKCPVCSGEFTTTLRPAQLKTMTSIVRTCPEHRNQWRTPVSEAWMDGELRDALRASGEDAVAAREQARPARVEKGPAPPRIGVVERVVLDVLADFELVGVVDERVLVGTVAARLPRTDALQDQRGTVARRALASLQRKGLA